MWGWGWDLGRSQSSHFLAQGQVPLYGQGRVAQEAGSLGVSTGSGSSLVLRILLLTSA